MDRISGTYTIYQIINGNLYSDINLTKIVGRVAISQTIYDTSDKNHTGLFETTGQTTIFLPNGSIMYTFSAETVKVGDNYLFPENTYTFNITNGTGVYQPMSGQITIVSDSEPSMELRTFTVALKWKNSNNYSY